VITKATMGSGFMGVVMYVTHDKGQAKTTERVTDTHCLNLFTDDPQQAARIMKATADKSTRCKQPVYHLSVSWHADDAGKLNSAVKMQQIREILASVGLEGHQALIVFHNDKPHPHAHIVVNRVHPQTLKAAQLSFDRTRRSEICRRLELEYGLTIAPLNERKEHDLAKKAVWELSYNRATFTEGQLYTWLNKRTQDEAEARKLTQKALSIAGVQQAGKDAKGRIRYTTKEYKTLEASLFRTGKQLADRKSTAIESKRLDASLAASRLSDEQKTAVREVLNGQDLTCLVGRAGAGKTTAMREVVKELEASGYRVIGAAPSGAAAKTLADETGIRAKTIHSWCREWQQEAEGIPANDPVAKGKTVILMDEAGMVSTRMMAQTLAHAEKTGAKVILVGDPDQLKAVEAGDAFRGLVKEHGASEIHAIRRQQVEWQREASEALAKGEVKNALTSYADKDRTNWQDTRQQGVDCLVREYLADRQAKAEQTRLILAYERNDVKVINARVRSSLKETGQIGQGFILKTETGRKEFAAGDRVVFGKNDYGEDLGVRNGSMGTVRMVSEDRLAVELDGEGKKRTVTFSMERYRHVDHGYAVTIHKSQGATVDKTWVLASKYLNKNAAYVALTRHREDCQIYADKETFAKGERDLIRAASRAPDKDLIRDYEQALKERFNRNQSRLKTLWPIKTRSPEKTSPETKPAQRQDKTDPRQAMQQAYEQGRLYDAALGSLNSKRNAWEALEAQKNTATQQEEALLGRMSRIYKDPQAALDALKDRSRSIGSHKAVRELVERPDAFGRIRGLWMTTERKNAISEAKTLMAGDVQKTLDDSRMAGLNESHRQQARQAFETAQEHDTITRTAEQLRYRETRLKAIRQLEHQIQAWERGEEQAASTPAMAEALKSVHAYQQQERAVQLAKAENNPLAERFHRAQMQQQAIHLAEAARQQEAMKEALEREKLLQRVEREAEEARKSRQKEQDRGMER
jgi:hypothetical protein